MAFPFNTSYQTLLAHSQPSTTPDSKYSSKLQSFNIFGRLGPSTVHVNSSLYRYTHQLFTCQSIVEKNYKSYTVGIVTITNSVESVSRKSSRTFNILSLSFSNLSACTIKYNKCEHIKMKLNTTVIPGINKSYSILSGIFLPKHRFNC